MTLIGAVTIAATACGTATVQPAADPAAKPAQLAASARPSQASSAATRPAPSNRQRAERTPAETIPAGATAATITLDPDANAHVKAPKSVTITDPAKVRGLVALVNGLPLFPPGRYSCPADGGARLVLTFRAHQGNPVLAVATVALEGCEGVDLTIRGRVQPGLGTPDGGRPEAVKALKTAGLNWSLPPFAG